MMWVIWNKRDVDYNIFYFRNKIIKIDLILFFPSSESLKNKCPIFFIFFPWADSIIAADVKFVKLDARDAKTEVFIESLRILFPGQLCKYETENRLLVWFNSWQTRMSSVNTINAYFS